MFPDLKLNQSEYEPGNETQSHKEQKQCAGKENLPFPEVVL
jgi:hypothetical protein